MMLERINRFEPDYVSVYAARQRTIVRMSKSPAVLLGAKEYYRTRPGEFISFWCDTYDPRRANAGDPLVWVPLVLFKRQHELVEFLYGCLQNEASGLIEKSRDMGATWICVAFSVWLWLFWPGVAVGWGSRKQDLVDRIGIADSIFEKIRSLILRLPRQFWPQGMDVDKHMNFMRVINPETGATIAGESGDEIGRGGRTLIYFKDESAHYEHPESIEAALSENTRVQIDMSSVNGLGNVFHRRREAGVDWEPGRRIRKDRTNVFVMDWRDHPWKTQSWYDEKRQKAQDDGLLHVFAQEVDRNYAASVDGTVIPLEWIKAAIDAHIELGFSDDGGWVAGLDVADEGGDRNALAKRKGVVLRYLEEWGERDVGLTARRAVAACRGTVPIEVMYDSVGIGAGVKAETNRLSDDKLMPRGMKLVAWNAGAGVVDPDRRVIDNDPQSPTNKDFYANLKAQAWWSLRRRLEKTYRAINEGIKYKTDELISIDSTLPRLRQLEKELSQPTASRSSRMKLLIDKAPDGSRSPNLADAAVMCYFPLRGSYDATLSWVR